MPATDRLQQSLLSKINTMDRRLRSLETQENIVGGGTIAGNVTITGMTHLGNQGHVADTGGLKILEVLHSTDDVSQNVYAQSNELWIEITSNSPRNYYDGSFKIEIGNITVDITGRVVGLQGQVDNEGDTPSIVSEARGSAGIVAQYGTGTITDAYGLYGAVYNLSSGGVITNGHAVFALNGQTNSTVVNRSGLTVQEQTGATNNVDALIGTDTIPAGNWAVYSASTRPSYIAGDMGFGAAPGATVDIAGTLAIERQGPVAISGGAISVSGSYMIVDTEGGAATDDLDTINGGHDGMILVLRSANSARDVTVKHGTGNIRLSGLADYTLSTTNNRLILLYDAGLANWYELSRTG